MSKIIIRKCAYVANQDDSGFRTESFDLKYGYVVVGLVGELYGTYNIPAKHNGLPIIGIVNDAYETMKEYGKKSHAGNYFYPSISIDRDTMLFVMPARRKKDRPRVYPSFGVNGYPYYAPSYFCYDPSNEINEKMAEICGGETDYLYTSLGKIDIGVEKREGGRVVGKDDYIINMTLTSSPSVMDEYKLGKYLCSPAHNFTFEQIKNIFNENKSVFVWMKMNYTRDGSGNNTMSFVFNTILGTDDCISAD